VADIELTDYGFKWGAAEVSRLADFNGTVVIRVSTIEDKRVEVYVSPAGRSLRVFQDGKELRHA
jgi:hypothetical protein